MTDQEKMAQLKDFLQSELDVALAGINEFSKDVVENPTYALQWSISAFKSAATIRIYSRLLKEAFAPNSKATLKSLSDYADNKVLTEAEYGSESTSVPSNYLDKCYVSCWASLARRIRDLLSI